MLAADNLLKALNNNNPANYKDVNEDYDLCDVLRFYGDRTEGHKIRYSDGTEKIVTFD